MEYEVIIAGGSFAGLAAAVQLRGRKVLLIEPNPIGAVRRSACGTLLAVLEATRTRDSLLQTHERFSLHLGDRTVEYPLPYPFCTFDYQVFCHLLLTQTDAEVLQASVIGLQGDQVCTSCGTYEAKLFIDASGWRAALASKGRNQVQPRRGMSFGLETTIPRQEEGLHFYYGLPELPPFQIGWLFPTGPRSRAGVGSYLGRTRLGQDLSQFIRTEFSETIQHRTGGYFPYRRRPATSEGVFRAGDAAGQCLPLSGEGIPGRRSLSAIPLRPIHSVSFSVEAATYPSAARV